jgi:hypothetical protein
MHHSLAGIQQLTAQFLHHLVPTSHVALGRHFLHKCTIVLGTANATWLLFAVQQRIAEGEEAQQTRGVKEKGEEGEKGGFVYLLLRDPKAQQGKSCSAGRRYLPHRVLGRSKHGRHEQPATLRLRANHSGRIGDPQPSKLRRRKKQTIITHNPCLAVLIIDLFF